MVNPLTADFPIPIAIPQDGFVWKGWHDCRQFRIPTWDALRQRYYDADRPVLLIPPLTILPNNPHETIRDADAVSAQMVMRDWAGADTTRRMTIARQIGQEQLKMFFTMNAFFGILRQSEPPPKYGQLWAHGRSGGYFPYYFPARTHPIIPLLSMTHASVFRWVQDVDTLLPAAREKLLAWQQERGYKKIYALAMGMRGEEHIVVASGGDLLFAASLLYWAYQQLQQKEQRCIFQFLNRRVKKQDLTPRDFAMFGSTMPTGKGGIWLPYAPADMYLVRLTHNLYQLQIGVPPQSGAALRFWISLSVNPRRRYHSYFRAIRMARALAEQLGLWPRAVGYDALKGVLARYEIESVSLFTIWSGYGDVAGYALKLQSRDGRVATVFVSPALRSILSREAESVAALTLGQGKLPAQIDAYVARYAQGGSTRHVTSDEAQTAAKLFGTVLGNNWRTEIIIEASEQPPLPTQAHLADANSNRSALRVETDIVGKIIGNIHKSKEGHVEGQLLHSARMRFRTVLFKDGSMSRKRVGPAIVVSASKEEIFVALVSQAAEVVF